MTAEKKDVTWTCPHCERDHHWNWKFYEIFPGQQIRMECDKCDNDTICQGDGSGKFTAVVPDQHIRVCHTCKQIRPCIVTSLGNCCIDCLDRSY